ncbi:MAG: PAS domain-containing sensor histidine kinase [Betaproteobacteria bacterium HGW-Betaproteobacteria-7]|jgi:PAS domain S-box-containing protein|nr:MAG: PAS domain-containing sensor histidine kinase [Betaproteobacteria bacterium HGW-Betaproteobacteria-7]
MISSGQRSALAPYALAALAAAAAWLLFISGLPVWLCALLLFVILAVALRAAQSRQTLDHEAEQRFRAVFDHALVGIGRVSPDGRWIDVNPTLARMVGYTPEEMQGKTWGEMTHPDDLEASRQAFASVLSGERDSYSLEKRYLRSDGTAVDAVILARGIRAADGQLEYLTAVITDVTERRRSEAALRLAMQVVNASPVVCFRWQACDDWPVVFVSDNVRQWGYSPEDLIAGRPDYSDMVHPDDIARVVEEVLSNTAAGKTAYDQEYRLITADNRVLWVLDRTQVIRAEDGTPLYYDGMVADITERKQQELLLADNLARQQTLNKRLEEASSQLMQSEKMASIGQLAAGIAHELNNPIGFVHSNLGTLDSYLHDLQTIVETYQAYVAAQPESAESAAIARLLEDRDFAFLKEDIFKLVAESKDGLGRVRKIVQDLKTFSRVGEQEWKEADLHQGLDSTLNIVWNELKYKCKVVKEYGDIPPVYCLISQLNQVFMNLLVNAGHAIETQGTITIRTGLHGTDSVCIEITDSGSGIPQEILKRIFDPFFTTKPIGKGTGLGLSLSYNIVRSHHGRLEVSSEPGVGSTFRVILPIYQAPGSDPAAKNTEPTA